MKTELHSEDKMSADPVTNSVTTRVSLTLDDTTLQLRRIWQQLLGVESVGLDQNYFDLGGDSILAVQLFAQIEQVFKVKLPVATLFDAPTIKELAQVLRRESPSSGWSPLVTIQAGGSRPPFFCIHGAGGNVLIYRELALHLGSDQPFYGLQSPGLDGSCAPLKKVEDMAALYVQEIRKAQPLGPYFLGGYCGGGTIAYEVAQQLRRDGEQVALLALFDSMNWSVFPPPTTLDKSYYNCQKLVFHAMNFLRLDWDGQSKFFMEKLRILRSRIPIWRGMVLARLFNNSETGRSESRILGEIWENNDRACSQYVPKPYAGVVTDFRPLKQYRMFDNPGARWERLAQAGQQIVTLPVYPAGMLVEPYVKHLADALRKSIDRAMSGYQPGPLQNPPARREEIAVASGVKKEEH
ncbi:MAG TPA: thioesterase domain-containing protein [Terriglobales bacterium]|nr:thioesterase domain-containing protein [Terriglobales bacterium]